SSFLLTYSATTDISPLSLHDALPIFSVSILVSLLISVTLTPMMCARLLRAEKQAEPRKSGMLTRGLHRMGEVFWGAYKRSLNWALAHGRFMMLLLAATIGLNFYLYSVIPKGFFPQQDTG